MSQHPKSSLSIRRTAALRLLQGKSHLRRGRRAAVEHPLQDLEGCWVLVIEDEYFIADGLRQALDKHGAVVIGPVPTLDQALVQVQSADRIDRAVVDINLQGQMAFPVADALETRGVPFVFATGYNPSAVPSRYQHVPQWQKPFDLEALVQALPALIHRS